MGVVEITRDTQGSQTMTVLMLMGMRSTAEAFESTATMLSLSTTA